MFVNPKLFFTNSRNPFVNGDRKCLFILDIPNRKNIRLLLIFLKVTGRICSKPIKIATVENVGLFLLTFFQREREYKFPL
jgi:hypothetical protein